MFIIAAIILKFFYYVFLMAKNVVNIKVEMQSRQFYSSIRFGNLL